MIVAKDPAFSTIDRLRASPASRLTRSGLRVTPRTYPDETTSYYWVVLPATGTTGGGAPGKRTARRASRLPQSNRLPPALVAPMTRRRSRSSRRFQLGAHAWREALPPAGRDRADVRLAAGRRHDGVDRVHRPEDVPGRQDPLLARPGTREPESNTGLTWSETANVRDRACEANARSCDPDARRLEPAGPRWFPVPGAVSYSLRIHEPNDTTPNTYSGYPVHGRVLPKITGTGIFSWEIRADFPKHPGTTPGPWSDPADLHPHDQGAHQPGVERRARTASC